MSLREAHIMMVEDEPLSRDMLARRLESKGFAVQPVADGPTCLYLLDVGPLPDLILLDVAMPMMSGLQVLGHIRQRWSTDALPVILVTAMVDSDDMVAGLEAGANDYVIKPINFPVLLARMRVALKIKDSIERLMEAERQRVMLQSLDAACNQVSQPLMAVVVALETLIRQPCCNQNELKESLRMIRGWTEQAGHVLNQLRQIAQMRSVPYTERLGLLDERHRLGQQK